MKPVRLSAHARGYLERRGCTEEEIRETIRTQIWQPARMGRQEAQQDFPYDAMWNGTWYAIKRVRPVFVEEQAEIVVVTVYTYFYSPGGE
jgi:hypothetical protein